MTDTPNRLPYDDEDVPQDDEGVKSQKVLDICGFAIDQAWDRIFDSDIDEKMTIDELTKLMRLAGQAHILATDVILNSSKLDTIEDGEDVQQYNTYEEEDEDEDDEDIGPWK